MSDETVLANARIVTRDAVISGAVRIRNGVIADIDEGAVTAAEAIDFDGDYLLPGLVEIHTDNLERHLQPRPGVMWPSAAAALRAHDVEIAGAGITTVLDAVSVGEYSAAGNRRQMIATVVETLSDPSLRDTLRAEHFLHLRCELADPAVLDIYRPHAGNPLVRLVSLMDHTPGQRQWADLSKWRQFNRDKKWSDAEFDAMVAQRRSDQVRHADVNRTEVIALARRNGTVMASHDDTVPEHVEEAVGEGVVISEFPTSLAAAEHARRLGMKVVMGAPNVVRGGSHSGNVSAAALADGGLLDGLSSDYVPASLLQAVFSLHRTPGIALNEAVAMVSGNPAEMVGLTDRGQIAPDLRADLVRLRMIGGVPAVIGVWRAGERVS